MAVMKCPVCGSKSFFVRDPDEEYEVHEFDLQDSKIVFNPDHSGPEMPEIVDDTDTYCNKCSWQGKFGMLKK
ncbi:MAG: hypothetical protein JRI50_10915 [Deltaproteobacteria bacterium]|nr:hypothetical protein [Deltaproteobacteria bacterium]